MQTENCLYCLVVTEKRQLYKLQLQVNTLSFNTLCLPFGFTHVWFWNIVGKLPDIEMSRQRRVRRTTVNVSNIIYEYKR